MQICLQVQKLLINQSGYLLRVSLWEIGTRKFVSHITVLQQLQFKMPEAVIKHHIWPLKVMFSNRIMPRAPNFDQNRKSIFLTSRLKIIAFWLISGGRVTHEPTGATESCQSSSPRLISPHTEAHIYSQNFPHAFLFVIPFLALLHKLPLCTSTIKNIHS